VAVWSSIVSEVQDDEATPQMESAYLPSDGNDAQVPAREPLLMAGRSIYRRNGRTACIRWHERELVSVPGLDLLGTDLDTCIAYHQEKGVFRLRVRMDRDPVVATLADQ